MKQIPNLFTLLNLLFGCIAIIYTLQPGLVPLYNSNDLTLVPDVTELGTQYVSIAEQIFMAYLFIASFPLIYWTNNYAIITTILISPWFWYAMILLLSYLMISKRPMLALKFSNTGIKKLFPFITIAVVAIVSAFFIGWLAVPLSFLVYVILSLLNKQPS